VSSTVFFAEQFWCPLTVASRVARVTPAGELDISTVATLDGALRQAEREADLVVLDLTGITFMDSSGARLLASTGRRMRWDRSRLLLDAVPEPVDRLLRLVASG
jgi:anti-sigma B factor antagonist